MNKIFEEADLELTQEAEFNNIIQAKKQFYLKRQQEKIRIKEMEEKEIKAKKEFEILKKAKIVENQKKKEIQKLLTSRVYSIKYLEKLEQGCLSSLISQGYYSKPKTLQLLDNIKLELFNSTSNMLKEEENLSDLLANFSKKTEFNQVLSHKNKIKEHKEMLKKRKDEEIRKKKEEEDEREKQRLAKIERKRKRELGRLRREIITKIISVASEYRDELDQINELNNNNNDEPASMIYGGNLGCLLLSLNILGKLLPDNKYYTLEIVYFVFLNIFLD